MDEYQLQVCPSLVDCIITDSEEEAEQYEHGDDRLSDVTHIEDKFMRGYSPVGEKMSLAIKEAAEYYNMRVPFDGDYQMGYNWKHAH